MVRIATGLRPLLLVGLLLPAACARHLSAAQIAVLKQQGFAPAGDSWQLSLGDKMLFDTGSSALKPATAQAVENTGSALHAVDIRNIRVEGHTDSTGTPQRNVELSQARAQVVADALGRRGVNGTVAAKGFGMANPVADNATDAGRAENRRVAVVVPDDQE